MYTDGLVEQRGVTIDDGLGRFLASAAGLDALPIEGLVDHLLQAVGPDDAPDDIALLT